METLQERKEGSHLELLVGYKVNLINYIKLKLATEEIDSILGEYDIFISRNDLLLNALKKLNYYKSELKKRNISVPLNINEVNYTRDEILPYMINIITYIRNRDLSRIKENSHIYDDGYYGFDNDYYFDNNICPSEILYKEKEKFYDEIMNLITMKNNIKIRKKINYEV